MRPLHSLSLLATALLGLPLGAQTARPTVPGNLATAPDRSLEDRDRSAPLAGVPTQGYPHFTYVETFQEGDLVRVGIDTQTHADLAGTTVDVYVTENRGITAWLADPTLVDVVGGPLAVTPVAGSLIDNVFVVDAGTLSASDGTTRVGIGYDVVIDVDRNGLLDGRDRIDGLDQAGFWVLQDLTQPGPLPVTTTNFNGGSMKRQRIYFPTDVAAMGKLPLVQVSHGNGHNYTWYDHIGEHLASWGYIVMSHENNTGPGIETASTTTLKNLNVFIANLANIAGGALFGHVDRDDIVWIGHSRGGEGVARAYKRLVEGDPIAVHYSASDIRLVSSIAPTDFLGTNQSNPLGVPYHLWVGGADADVTGCASSDIAQSFHLLGRATGERMSISLHGVGHGDFHDGGGSSVAAGPCRVGRPDTHTIMRGYLLPLIKSVLEDSLPCREYLQRQYESFRPLGAPSDNCVVADLTYQAAPADRVVIDDFQTETSTTVSSSGGAVAHTLSAFTEARLDDGTATFTNSISDPMNGMTWAASSDNSRGIVFEWDGSRPDPYLLFEVPPGLDLSKLDALSFRAAQAARHPLTRNELGDLDFSVELTDSFGQKSAIRISAYGGGIEEPYQRSSCGSGIGWANEFETIRIPLVDFRAAGQRVDIDSIVAVGFRFGIGHGSEFGRIGLDDIEFTRE